MEELVTYLVKGLVDTPEQVHVNTVESGSLVVHEVSVAQEDLGKVIGRGGRIAEALRTIVRAVSSPDGRRHTVEIIS
mgnify:CR=1 FL=1|jgi:predicted RNA-binding protein YlqC (UPF0109 family)